MLSYLLRQLTNSFGIFFRTIRAFFTRKLVGAWSYLRRITNFSRQATRVATTSFQGAATVIKKPTKREDYIETQYLFISKSFLLMLAVGAIAAVLLAYFVVWPFLLSRFLVARFYQEDRKLSDWSGRVIVYQDEERRIPLYQGTLQEGRLEGLATEYDEDGLLIYEGDFSDGVRSGEGSLYEAGILVYTGQFSGGVPNGTGTAYADGVKCYQGDFVDGLYEGEGVTYHPNGNRAYVGSFAAGLFEGEGTEYTDDKQMRYKGSFAQGLYDGNGTVHLDDGSQIRAEFTAGVTNGVIQWYQKGRLWYDGGADNLAPDGFGTLYAENGKAVYTGQFDRGTLDGAWLLSLTAEALREAFAEAPLAESDSDEGFLVTNETIGLTALCSYQQEETASEVYRLWFSPEADSPWAALLPWESGSEAALWAVEGQPSEPQESLFEAPFLQPDGTDSESCFQRQYLCEDFVCTLLSRSAQTPPFEVYWGKDAQPVVPPDDATSDAVGERLDTLLLMLNGEEPSESGQTADPAQVSQLLGLALTARNGETLMDALIDCCVYGEMATSLESSQPILQQALETAQAQLQRGEITQQAVDQAQAELESLEGRLTQYLAARDNADLTIQELTRRSALGMDLRPVLLVFDPTGLDSASLSEAALSYAKRTAEDGETVDSQALDREVKSAVLELGLCYESVRSARTAAEAAVSQLDEITLAYAKGASDREALLAARLARDEAAAGLYQSLGSFTHQANRLNALCGGWLAKEYDWMSGAFAALY